MFSKKDLKNGDVVIRANGDAEIVLKDLDMLICKEGGYNHLSEITENLQFEKHCDDDWFLNEEYDIIKVYRPKISGHCSTLSCRYTCGDLVYDRNQIPREMTLEEIEAELGHKVKIVARKENY